MNNLFNIPKLKPAKKEVLWCRACKCKTLKTLEKIDGTEIWTCTRIDHEVNLQKHFESLAIKNLDDKYQEELKKEV